MGLPAQRHTRGQKKRRASHFALKKITTTKCGNCKKQILPHHVCANCGQYKGRQVLVMKVKKNKQK